MVLGVSGWFNPSAELLQEAHSCCEAGFPVRLCETASKKKKGQIKLSEFALKVLQIICLIHVISNRRERLEKEITCSCGQGDVRGCIPEEQTPSVKHKSQILISLKFISFQETSFTYRYRTGGNISRSVTENDNQHVQELHVDLPSKILQVVKWDQIQA